ncbi:MAG: glycogen synthase GlgA [Candidatus Marinimicrobia bacterium]|nr:glycogen synthase GlgA [Candidatus Neomarinimicrobiota bacterium]MCF7830025.1 glycogen synthase GlgA [Candidatus Neomarinimicrobiota bacterium]MCF7881933.1 glycogen synthase GlgA [Candidatus Neomarinimicrobiota bacterium]
MKILFATAEVTPFSKVGGLADVAGALPKALENLDVETRIITPGYATIPFEDYVIKDVDSFDVPVGNESYKADLISTVLPDTDRVEVIFVRNREFFDRDGVYVDSKTGEGFPDEAERFIFFMQAILQWLERSEWMPNILHCNDHHTALLPAYLRETEFDTPELADIKSIFTIHNMGYQGIHNKSVLNKTVFPEKAYSDNGAFDWNGDVNFMKVALRYADKINTVSPTYAREIMSSEEYGFGLQDEIKKRKKDVSGILNGVDYSEWSPENDSLIPYNYSAKEISGKKKNRDELLRKNRIMAERTTPIIGMVSRLVDQKGLDLIDEALQDLLDLDIRLIVLGTGAKKYHYLFEEAKEEYPDKVAVNFAYNNPMAHLIEAGSDMFLMPSKYEPCGLNQMYSLKYGTIPIVHATGGLADTIDNFDSETKEGNGFSFDEYTSEAMMEAIERAIRTFRNKALWKFLRDNAMRCDFSWEVSAGKYIDLYESVLE